MEELRKLIFSTIIIFLLIFIFIIGLVYLFRKRQNELLLKSQLEEEQFKNEILAKELENQNNLIRERERISEDIHDDIGGVLSAIKLQSEFIQSKNKDVVFQDSLDTITEYSSIAILNFREMIWCLHSRNDKLSVLIAYIIDYFKNLLEASQIHFDVNQPIIHDEIDISSYSRRQILLSVKEIINNAIKYSHSKKLKMSIILDGNSVLFTIHDFGKGLPENFKKGNGFHNIEKRILSIYGEFSYSNSNQGLESKIMIPLLNL